MGVAHGKAFDLDHHAGMREAGQRYSRDRGAGTLHRPKTARDNAKQIVLIDAAVAHVKYRELDQVSEIGAGAAKNAVDEIHGCLRLSPEIADVLHVVALVQVDLTGDENHLVADDALAVVRNARRQPPMAGRNDVTAWQHQTSPDEARSSAAHLDRGIVEAGALGEIGPEIR
jgi:hypothetical protein